MKFRPLYDRILVKRVEAEEKTAGGLIVPDSAKESPARPRSSLLVPDARTPTVAFARCH